MFHLINHTYKKLVYETMAIMKIMIPKYNNTNELVQEYHSFFNAFPPP